MAAPNIIGGNLPWNAGPAANMFMGATNPTAGLASLGPAYANAYNSALAMNATNYENILAGYQQTMAAQTSAQDAIAAGYTRLGNEVLGGIRGAGSTAATNINDAYARMFGEQQQSLIDRGLGNTTVQNAVGRGITLDREKALASAAEQFAGLLAGYQSNLGLASLGSQREALAANTALSGRQLDWMNSVKAAYPDAGAYAQMAQMYGAARQAEQDRRNQPANVRPWSGGAGGAFGYIPSGGGFGAPKMNYGGPPGLGGGLGGFGGGYAGNPYAGYWGGGAAGSGAAAAAAYTPLSDPYSVYAPLAPEVDVAPMPRAFEEAPMPRAVDTGSSWDPRSWDYYVEG